MIKPDYLFIALFVLAFGYSIAKWVKKPFLAHAPRNANSKNCMACHQNSISQDAWKGIPSWHSEKFCNPILNSENREEHRREAHIHRNKCMTCHAPHFQAKCANCHTQNEWK